MRLPKSKLGKAIALAIAIYGIRLAIKSAGEWVRYDKIRGMSDEPPFVTQLPKLAGEALAEEGGALAELMQFLVKAPFEVARYVRMESM